MKLSIATVLLTSVTAAPRAYPAFKQCGSAWGSNEMGVNGPGERSTICGEGCAMTSLSMVLAGLDVKIGGASTNPSTFNKWLMGHDGYLCLAGDCNNLRLNAVAGLTSEVHFVSEAQKPSLSVMAAGVNSGKLAFIAHVRDSSHFVLVTGVHPENKGAELTVNDPYYNSTTYAFSGASDVITYAILAKGTELTSRSKTASAVTAALRGTGGMEAEKRRHRMAVNRFSVVEGGAPAAAAHAFPLPGGAEAEGHDIALQGTPVMPFAYPLYKQCDPRWGQDLIETETVCAVGCLMSSTSMAIGGKHIPIGNVTSNPGVLNSWLRTHGGYDSSNDMYESAIPRINPTHIAWPADGMHVTNDIPIATIQKMLLAGRPVIAWVMNRRHFVLVTGWDSANPDTLLVNDPGFNRTTYSYTTDVVGWRLFLMSPCTATSC